MYRKVYTVGMTKRYSIAEARAHLPSIVDEVEVGKPVELTRRGKPVAVVLSLGQYHLMSTSRANFSDAYREFCGRFDLKEVGLDGGYVNTLRAGGAGRKVQF